MFADEALLVDNHTHVEGKVNKALGMIVNSSNSSVPTGIILDLALIPTPIPTHISN